MDVTQTDSAPRVGPAQPELTPEMEKTLARYVEIQEEMRVLQEEKDSLRDALVRHLAGSDRRTWFPSVGGGRLKVNYSSETVIDYNGDILRERLGDRYTQLLEPDLKKMRRHLREIEPCLAPVIGTVGSVSREKVRDAIENGVVEAREFSGAFEKRQQTRIAVARLRVNPPAPGDPPQQSPS